MQFNRISNATILGAVLTTLLGTAAFADSIYVESPVSVDRQIMVPSVAVPQTSSTVVEKRIVTPATPTVVEKQVVIPTSPTVVEQRSVVSTPAVVDQIVVPSQPETIMKRSVTIGTREKPNSVQSTQVTTQTAPAPVFQKRIQNMKEQVDLGVSKGYLSRSNAESFRMRLDSLNSEADSVVAEGTPKDLSDRLEKRLTGINIEISNAMNPESRVGSDTQIQ